MGMGFGIRDYWRGRYWTDVIRTDILVASKTPLGDSKGNEMNAEQAKARIDSSMYRRQNIRLILEKGYQAKSRTIIEIKVRKEGA